MDQFHLIEDYCPEEGPPPSTIPLVQPNQSHNLWARIRNKWREHKEKEKQREQAEARMDLEETPGKPFSLAAPAVAAAPRPQRAPRPPQPRTSVRARTRGPAPDRERHKVPMPRSAESNVGGPGSPVDSMLGAVQQKIDNTFLSTIVLGPNGCGKSFFVNTMLEDTCPNMPTEGTASAPASLAHADLLALRASIASAELYGKYVDEVIRPDPGFFHKLDDKMERQARNVIRDAIRRTQRVSSRVVLDDARAFLLPQGLPASMSPAIAVRYGAVPELIVKYPSEEKLRRALFRLHDLESGARKLDYYEYEALKQSYQQVLGISRKDIDPRLTSSPGTLPLPKSLVGKLGRRFRFTGLGMDLTCDRIFVRDNLKRVIEELGCFVEELIIRFPSTILENNIEIIVADSHNLHTPNRELVLQLLRRVNFLLVAFDKRGLTEDTRAILKESGFLPKVLADRPNAYRTYRMLFLDMLESRAHEDEHVPSKSLLDASRKVCEAQMQHQFRSFLLETLSEPYRGPGSTELEERLTEIAKDMRILHLQPLVFASLALNSESTVPESMLHDASVVELRDGTQIPTVIHLVQNMQLSLCAQILHRGEQLEMTNPRPTAGSMFYPMSPRSTSPQQAPHRRSASMMCAKKSAASIRRITGQLRDSVHHWRRELRTSEEALEEALQHKAHESYQHAYKQYAAFKERFLTSEEQCRELLNPETNGQVMGVSMHKWICGVLLVEAPRMWHRSFVECVPKRLDELVHLSADLLNELSRAAKDGGASREYCAKLGRLFRGGPEQSMIARFEQLRGDLEQDAAVLVEKACVAALKRNVLRKSRSVCGLKQYQKLVLDHLPQVPLDAAHEIQRELHALVERCTRRLEELERQLDLVYRLDMSGTRAELVPDEDDGAHEGGSGGDSDGEADGELHIQRRPPRAQRPAEVAPYDPGSGMHLFDKQQWQFRFGSQGAALFTRFQAQMSASHLKTQHVAGDGNNQFRALAHLVYGSEEAHSLVRLLVMDELLKNPAPYERQLPVGVPEYVCRMAKDGVHGDHVTLNAMANVYGADLLVFSPLFKRPLVLECAASVSSKDVYPIAYVSADRFLPLISMFEPTFSQTTVAAAAAAATDSLQSSAAAASTGGGAGGAGGSGDRTDTRPAKAAEKHSNKMVIEVEDDEGDAGTANPLRRARCGSDDAAQRGQRAQGLSAFESALCLTSLSGGDSGAGSGSGSSAGVASDGAAGGGRLSGSGGGGGGDRKRSLGLSDSAGMDVEEDRFVNPNSMSLRFSDPRFHVAARKRSAFPGHRLPITPPMRDGECGAVGQKRSLPPCSMVEALESMHQAHKKRRKEEDESEQCGTTRAHVDSLLDLCIQTVTRHVDMMPALEGCLPEELLQSITTQLIEQGKLNDHVLERLLDSSITALNLSHCRTVTNRSCGLIADACPMITHISLSYCGSITDEGIISIANSCPYLRSVDLEGCITIGDRALTELAQQCRRIESVNLAGCLKVTNEGIAILQSCPNIQSLNLKRCSQITDPVFEELGHSLQALDLSECSQLTDNAVIQIARRSSDNLQTLKLSGRNITDASLQHVADQCTHLRELELVGCERISDSAIYTLARMCTRLQVLNLTRCKNITANAFRMTADHVDVIDHLQRGMYNLQRLDLTHCLHVTDDALRSISHLCPNLLELNLTQCEVITDTGIAHIAERGHALRRIVLAKCMQVTDTSICALARSCRDLTSVVLRQCNVSDVAMRDIARYCPGLKELDVTACEGVTDATVSLFSRVFTGLESLCLEELSDLSDNAIGALADGCSELLTLKLAYCNVTDRTLQRLARGCPRMQHMDLSYCTRVSLEALSRAVQMWGDLRTLVLGGFNHLSDTFPAHPKLETIRLPFSKSVEDGCVIAIAEGCPRLQHLDIAWCAKVSGNSIGRLVRGCPLINTLNLRQCTNISPRIAGLLSTRGITVYR